MFLKEQKRGYRKGCSLKSRKEVRERVVLRRAENSLEKGLFLKE